MIDLQALHAAGADVAGVHADAWLRLPGVRSGEFTTKAGGVLERVRAMHAQLGRRILPTDLTGAPVPQCAGGELPKTNRLTPARIAQDNSVPLNRDQIRSIQVVVEQCGGREIAAKRIGINGNTITRALAGERLMPETIARILGNLSSPDGDIDSPAPADEPGKPLPGEAPGQATIEPEPPPAQEAEPMSESTDVLISNLIAAIEARPRGARGVLAKTLGLHPTFITTWKRLGAVPSKHRDRVKAWIAEEPIPDTEPKQTAKPAKAAKIVPPWDQPEQKQPTGIDLRAVAAALGFQPRACYVVQDGKLVECMAVVLP